MFHYLYGDRGVALVRWHRCGERLLMFEHAVYTVATPEACAAILWKDASRAPKPQLP